MHNKVINTYRLIISLIIPQVAGIIGAVFASTSIPIWYRTLNKPALNPPEWIFGPVWSLLYVLIGVTLFLVWKENGKKNIRKAVLVFALQIALNALWSVIFFGLKNPFLAFINIVLLWIAIVWNMIVFNKISEKASILLIPYLLWVIFAGYLNYFIWTLN